MPQNSKSKIRHAFSLIELLVVIAIIALLLTIGIGVGQKVMTAASVKTTKANMAIIMNAIETYYEDTGSYPSPESTPGSSDLYNNLRINSSALEKLASLPADAVYSDGTTGYFVDAFDKEIEYSKTGGLGGTPVLLSAGPDGDITTKDDNIRSDK
jgi:prepilin-type N-terminal cleavage/methylation domain-containing protein